MSWARLQFRLRLDDNRQYINSEFRIMQMDILLIQLTDLTVSTESM